jgi:hypothetical protein
MRKQTLYTNRPLNGYNLSPASGLRNRHNFSFIGQHPDQKGVMLIAGRTYSLACVAWESVEVVPDQ